MPHKWNVTKSPFSATAPQEFPAFGRGMQLGARRIVALQSASARQRTGPRAQTVALKRAWPHSIATSPNLTSDWAGSTQPEILIVHGDTNKQGQAVLPALWPTPCRHNAGHCPSGTRHNALLEAMREGVLADIIAWLTGTQDTPSRHHALTLAAPRTKVAPALCGERIMANDNNKGRQQPAPRALRPGPSIWVTIPWTRMAR